MDFSRGQAVRLVSVHEAQLHSAKPTARFRGTFHEAPASRDSVPRLVSIPFLVQAQNNNAVRSGSHSPVTALECAKAGLGPGLAGRTVPSTWALLRSQARSRVDENAVGRAAIVADERAKSGRPFVRGNIRNFLHRSTASFAGRV